MWTKPSDIANKVTQWWNKGELLSEIAAGTNSFPRTINFKRPTSSELSHNYEQVKQWIAELKSIKHGEIVWQETNHRIVGRNKIPVAIKFANYYEATQLIGKERQTRKFEKLVEKIRAHKPAIMPWVESNPHEVLALENEWDKLVNILTWFETHPIRDIYLRQVDVPNVHTKMLEDHKTTLSALLNYVLPASNRANRSNTSKDFEQRFGFRSKPLRIRFRMLDPERSILSSSRHIQDITLDAESFVSLHPQIRYVFIVENEINFLAFPALKDALVIFGSGFGFENLANASWLFEHKVIYWGDIDTYGMSILNSARKFLPHLQSMMMDSETLLTHKQHWVEEPKPSRAIYLSRLTTKEHDLYDKLRANQFGENIRLEQEKLPWGFVEREINQIIDLNSDSLPLLSTSPELVHDGDNCNIRSNRGRRFSDSDLSNFLHPSVCDLRAYLNFYPSEKGSVDRSAGTMQEILRREFEKQKNQAKTKFDCALDVSQFEDQERINATRNAIANRVRVIINPKLSTITKIDAIDCDISAEADFLILEDDGYVVRNLALSRHLVNTDSSGAASNNDRNIRLQLFGWVFWKATKLVPAKLELQNKEGELALIQFDFGCSTLRRITELFCIRRLESAPYSPVGWTKCAGCNYEKTCWSEAEFKNDVALLVGVDQKLAKTLHRLGFKSINSLVENLETAALANLQKSDGEKISRVGRPAAESIMFMAQSLAENRHIVRKQPNLPEFQKYAIIDLEGLPLHAPNSDFVFLWGMQVFGGEHSQYFCSFSSDIQQEDDRESWFHFLQHCESEFKKNGPIHFLHWHHYERVKLEKYIENYGDLKNIGRQIIESLIDLLPVTQQSVALPIPSYSLKVVEKFVGFQRQQKQYGGDWAMSRYLDYLTSTEQSERDEIKIQICLYNAEDILATNAVLTWLRSLAV